MSDTFDKRWWMALEEALGTGVRLISGVGALNGAADHVVQLLQDASDLLERGSHASAAFLSITALEELAKCHLGMYRSGDAMPRRKDALFSHDKKHRLAVAPTVAMGSRLQEAIGEARMQELMEMASTGALIPLREASLYFSVVGDQLTTPQDAIDPSTTRELLLFVIEVFDDALVGYTSHTFELGETTDSLFDIWKEKRG